MRQLLLPELSSELIFTYGSLSECIKNLRSLVNRIAREYTQCTLITDRHVFKNFGHLLTGQLEQASLPYHTIILPPGEESKTLITASRCWSEMFQQGADRKSCVLAFGGGSITDIAGFVAGCYMRGIDLISIPTTLLGMVDASIGGKSGVNFEGGKNLIGVTHQPKVVFISPSFLKTLPEREFRSGLAEVIKYGVIKDPILFEFLENNADSILARETESLQLLIERSVEIKAHIVMEDPWDRKKIRALLNWGHTVGHAIESASGYKELHGEAVAIGMSCEGYISYKLGYASREFWQRQDRLISKLELPTKMPEIPVSQLLELMKKDKKALKAKINLIIAEKIGKVFLLPNIEPEQIKEALLARNDAYNNA